MTFNHRRSVDLFLKYLGLIIGMSLVASGAINASAQSLVVIDAGHGGADPGAVGCQREEATHVLDVAQRTKLSLESTGARVELTRTDDQRVDLRARAEFANQLQADAFVSIHANANSGAPASGTETWIADAAGARTLALATALQDEMIQAWGLRDRGVKRRNFTVLTATNMSAALTEIGFINRCDTDSELIGDPVARQEIALAHAEGVAQFLSLPPPDGEVMPTPTGTLQGVVFEDRGEGLDDPSRRLGGVEVTLASTDDLTLSSQETGAWSFDLEPGNYVVEGRLTGYLTGRRECRVIAGEQTWCSFGLRLDDRSSGADMGGEVELDDSGVGFDDGGLDRDFTVEGSDMMDEADMGSGDPGDGESDAGSPRAGMEAYDIDGGSFDRLASPPRVGRSDEGCQSAPRGCGGALWILVITLFIRRRLHLARTSNVASTSIMIGLVAMIGVNTSSSALAHVPDFSAYGEVAVRSEGDLSLEISSARRLIRGDYLKALISPTGAHILLVQRDGASISVIETTEGAKPRPLITLRGAGRNPQWGPRGQLIMLHTPDQAPHARPLLHLSLTGEQVSPPLDLPQRSLKVSLTRGEARVNGRLINPEVDTFFYARVAPDQGHAIFWGLKTGLWLYRAWDHALLPLGGGGHPSFGPDGHILVFERTAEERGALTGSDLFCLDLTQPLTEASPLTQTTNILELAPSIAGRLLTFVDGEGSVWLATLQGVK